MARFFPTALALPLCALALCVSAILLPPRLASAQPASADSSAQAGDLRSTIRAELLSDPRTAGLLEADLEAMVEALANEAQKQGLTAHDITWRPASGQTSAAAASSCGNIPTPLCTLNQAFGFSGADPTLPVWLGIAVALLILLIGIMLELRHRGSTSNPTPQM